MCKVLQVFIYEQQCSLSITFLILPSPIEVYDPQIYIHRNARVSSSEYHINWYRLLKWEVYNLVTSIVLN